MPPQIGPHRPDRWAGDKDFFTGRIAEAHSVLREKERASRRPTRSARTSASRVKTGRENPGQAGPNGATPNAKIASPGELGETPAGVRILEAGPLIDGGGKTWRIHPLATIMPPMPDREYTRLKKSASSAEFVGRNCFPNDRMQPDSRSFLTRRRPTDSGAGF